MKKIFFALLTLSFLHSSAQQSITTSRISIKDSLYFDGAWRKRWPGSSAVVGGIVTWVSGLQFAVTSAKYTIKDKDYTSNSGTVTLNAAHVSLPRIDVIALNTSGQIVRITGTAAATPAIPQIDPTTQVYLTAVFVGAGATSPGGITTQTIYDENVEWTAATPSFPTITFSGTTSPYTGTKTIDVTGTNSTSDVSASGGFKMFNGASTYNYSDYTVLRFYIRLKSAWVAQASLQVGLGNGGEPLTTITAANGFDPSLVGVYQNISVPLSQIPKTASSFSAFYFIVTGNGKGFYLDNIQLQGGVGGGQGAGYVTNVFKKAGTDSIFITINGMNIFSYLDTGTGGSGDNWGSQVVQHTNDLTGNGTSGSNLGVNYSNISTVQRLIDSLAALTTKYKPINWFPKLNEIQSADAVGGLNNTALQIWQWTNGSYSGGLELDATPSSLLGGTAFTFNSTMQGTNPASSATTYAGMFSNSRNGTNSTAVGIRASASGATNNYAIIVPSNSGYVGFGTSTPSALLHLAAGTTTVAPFKLTSGTALTTPQDGAIEYHGSHLYFTIGGTRYQLDQQGGGGGGAWGSITGTLSSQTDLQTALNAKADLASPALTGSPTAPTPTASDNSTKVATTAFVKQMAADSAFNVVRPVTNGTVKLFETVSSTKLQIADLSAGTGAKVWKGSDSVARISADTVTNLNSQTGTSYTLVIGDQYGKTVTLNNASANTCTVPPNSSVAFPVGTVINVVSIGAGQTTIAAGSGVTINSADSKLKLRVRYSAGTLIKTATDTWLLIGDISL